MEDLVKEGLGNEMLEPIVLTINPDDSSTSENQDDGKLF